MWRVWAGCLFRGWAVRQGFREKTRLELSFETQLYRFLPGVGRGLGKNISDAGSCSKVLLREGGWHSGEAAACKGVGSAAREKLGRWNKGPRVRGREASARVRVQGSVMCCLKEHYPLEKRKFARGNCCFLLFALMSACLVLFCFQLHKLFPISHCNPFAVVLNSWL